MHAMKTLVSVDAEGLQGTVSARQIFRNGEEYQKLTDSLAADIRAVVEGLKSEPGMKIDIVDSHEDSTNISWNELPGGVRLITGSPKPLGMVEGVQDSDRAVFLGFHPMAGTNGVLNETYSFSVHRVWFNGIAHGEIGICAAVCGHFNVPVTMMAGDDTAVKEAEALLGEAEYVVLKNSLSKNAASSMVTGDAAVELRNAAERSLKVRGKPYRIDGPVEVKIEFNSTDMADNCEILPGVSRDDGYTVSISGKSIIEAYQYFRILVMIGSAGSKY